MLTVRVGCNIHFECESSATVILLVNPRSDSRPTYKPGNSGFRLRHEIRVLRRYRRQYCLQDHPRSGTYQIRHDAMVEGSTAFDKSDQLEMPHRSPRLNRHFCATCYPADIAIRTSCSLSPEKSSDTYTTRVSACRPSPTGFITTSSIALLPEGRTFQLRKSSNGATASAAISRTAR